VGLRLGDLLAQVAAEAHGQTGAARRIRLVDDPLGRHREDREDDEPQRQHEPTVPDTRPAEAV
jgi:hypothetical protein